LFAGLVPVHDADGGAVGLPRWLNKMPNALLQVLQPSNPEQAIFVECAFHQGLKPNGYCNLHVWAKQAAEKGLCSNKFPVRHPAGAKARLILLRLLARLKSCPFKTSSFSAACKAQIDSAALTARLKSCPFKAASFSATCKARTLQDCEMCIGFSDHSTGRICSQLQSTKLQRPKRIAWAVGVNRILKNQGHRAAASARAFSLMLPSRDGSAASPG